MNKRYVSRTFLVMAAVMAAGPTLSDSLDLNLNSDVARLTFARPIYDNKLEIDAGWLHHQDRGNLLSVSLGRFGEAGGGQQSVTAAIGGRLYGIDPDFGPATGMGGPNRNQDGFALGVGGLFRLKLAGYDRIGFSGHGYYAPDVLAFGDSEDLIEVAGRVTYSVIRDADVYLGIRYINAGFEGLDAKFDTGLHIGIRLEF
ncbi:MAG: YfaZ family protein [Gammaproteobacteria bacterium]|nr:YfaZ family protein [Gammaproteobacteria bacterium]